MILLAILVPWVALMLEGHTVPAAICLGLQLTLIRWIPAAICAVSVSTRAHQRPATTRQHGSAWAYRQSLNAVSHQLPKRAAKCPLRDLSEVP